MGFVKLKKSGSEFDLLPAEGILNIANQVSQIDVTYSTGVILSINTDNGSPTDEDVNKITDAALKIEGASGEGIFTEELSSPVTGIDLNYVS
jgi:hypothetical protein